MQSVAPCYKSPRKLCNLLVQEFPSGQEMVGLLSRKGESVHTHTHSLTELPSPMVSQGPRCESGLGWPSSGSWSDVGERHTPRWTDSRCLVLPWRQLSGLSEPRRGKSTQETAEAETQDPCFMPQMHAEPLLCGPSRNQMVTESAPQSTQSKDREQATKR